MFGVSGYGSDYLWFVGASMRGVDASYPGILTTIEPPDIPKEIKDREIHNVGFEAFIENAVASGLRWSGTHTAGDKALDLTLDAIEKGSARAGYTLDQIRAKGHAIDHCTLNPRPDQIPRLQKLNIMMSCGPKYINKSPRVLRDYGEKYLSWVAPLKSLLDANVKTVMEVDDNEIFKVGTVFHYLDVMVNREVEGKVFVNGKERIDRVLGYEDVHDLGGRIPAETGQDGLPGARQIRGVCLVLDSDYFTVGTANQKNQTPAYRGGRQDPPSGAQLLIEHSEDANHDEGTNLRPCPGLLDSSHRFSGARVAFSGVVALGMGELLTRPTMPKISSIPSRRNE